MSATNSQNTNALDAIQGESSESEQVLIVDSSSHSNPQKQDETTDASTIDSKIDAKDGDHLYDIAIVGAGMAGVLLASQLSQLAPHLSVILVEQNPCPGGRAKTSTPGMQSWGLGFHWQPSAMITALGESLLLDPTSPTLDFCSPKPIGEIGFLSGSSLSRVGWNELFQEKGFKVIGGLAARRSWPVFEKACQAIRGENRKNQTFQTLWTDTRKSPAAVVLSQLATLLGIPDVWHTRADLLVDHALKTEIPVSANWNLYFKTVLENLTKNPKFTQRFECQVLDCKKSENQGWLLETSLGQIKASRVVVAQPPWSALDWISKTHWPKELLQLAVKAKPVSIVSISDSIDPDLLRTKLDGLSAMMVMSENVMFIAHESGEMVFRTPVDYEISLQAPEVVKTIKALRRARRKVFKYLNLSEEETKDCVEHVCLTSVGWSHSTQLGDERLFDRIEGNLYTDSGLFFVGDAYGKSNFAEENILSSVKETFVALTSDPAELTKRRKRQGASAKSAETQEEEESLSSEPEQYTIEPKTSDDNHEEK